MVSLSYCRRCYMVIVAFMTSLYLTLFPICIRSIYLWQRAYFPLFHASIGTHRLWLLAVLRVVVFITPCLDHAAWIMTQSLTHQESYWLSAFRTFGKYEPRALHLDNFLMNAELLWIYPFLKSLSECGMKNCRMYYVCAIATKLFWQSPPCPTASLLCHYSQGFLAITTPHQH